MIHISELRKNYALGELDEAHAQPSPHAQFQLWLDEALHAQLPEATAMTLATVGPDGQPSTRIVLLKNFNNAGLVWYTNQESRKGQEIAQNPKIALQFHWVELERTVRVEGLAVRLDNATADAYFHSRPLGSRHGAWASPQSQVIPNRSWLQQAWADAAQTHGDHPARPPQWGGYCLQPTMWEFWQGRPSRLHDRLRYRQAQDVWVVERLAP